MPHDCPKGFYVALHSGEKLGFANTNLRAANLSCQPTLARQIKTFWTELGMPRKGRGARLSKAQIN